MVSSKKSKEDIHLMMVVSKLHHEGYLQKKIADQLGLNASTVSRLLNRAQDFIEIRYNFPGYEDLEAELVSRYELTDAIVVDTGNEKYALEILGQAAARYFVRHVEPEDHIAFSCGETLLEMVKALPTRRNLKLTISQLSIESDPETIHQAPSTLVGILKAKSSSDSYVYGLQLPPIDITGEYDMEFRHKIAKSEKVKQLHNQALKANFVFVGVGVPYSLGRKQKQSYLNIACRVVPDFEIIAKNLRIVGELNNQVFDEKGYDRTSNIKNLSDAFINLLSLDEIKKLANKRSKCKVVLVASGIKKSLAIKTALQSGLANVIITGRDDAKRLL